ncbi:sensor histidine kinase [Chitinophaga arvensicola]|uniref:Histidine kinase n=1 Tax=Chitinophaga arvensicola TaxID=29529 RepID=A0A1I0S579_9BACT|nr:sensor histidine kinase [Chitinophaga arvensicola]SEW49853.1 Histidine kinase [Chitinophaga arvensicola]
MQLINRMSTAARVQWALWLVVFFMMFFSMLPEDGFGQAVVFSLLNVLFYALVIYGNINWLFVQLYLKGRIVVYVIAVLVFLLVTGLCRGFLLTWIYNTWFTTHPEPLTMKIMLRYLTGIPLLFLLSFVFRMAIVYFELKAQAAALVLQHAKTELDLLKSQVQPHFLFNTLNNIYYEAYREAPRTAALIERLSDMMRYFVEESPKDQVDIATEIAFLENYIALERIRIRHEIALTFIHDIPPGARIPPMLLMTFTENIFKHGIDKASQQNEIELQLVQQNGRLHFRTRNSLPAEPLHNRPGGSGIDNLRKRLSLLYGADFTLQANQSGHYFTAVLSVPL